MENFDTREMKISEYKKSLEDWLKLKTEEAKKEDTRIKEDDWEC